MSRPALLLIVLSFGTLGIVLWWDWSVFAEIGVEMPAVGWIALVLGVVMTLIVGCGLMFLVFYSSRHGYDDAPGRDDSSDPRPDPP